VPHKKTEETLVTDFMDIEGLMSIPSVKPKVALFSADIFLECRSFFAFSYLAYFDYLLIAAVVECAKRGL